MRRFLVLMVLLLCLPVSGRAQLAQSFYNITGIKTDVLPNAVRVTVETDGNVNMGVDFDEFIDFGPTGEEFSLRPLRKFRLRFVGAKAKIPAFVEVGKYPVDAVSVTLARDPFKSSFFYEDNGFNPMTDTTTPALDLEFRFYVPIKVSYFTFIFGRNYGWTFNYSTGFQPRDVTISVGPDQRSIIITAMTDRAESNRHLGGIKRSPPENWKHRLAVTPSLPDMGAGKFSVDALHARLSDILDGVAKITEARLEAQPDVAERDISLFLPNTDVTGLVQALTTGYGLSAINRPETEGGGRLIGAAGPALLSERIPVHYSSPDNLRLLLPDFLLPSLRVDAENNTLIVTGSQELIDRVRSDIARLDVPPATIRVEAQAFEVNDTTENVLGLSALFSQGKVAFNTDAGTVATLLTDNQKKQYAATLTALTAKGKAKIMARPSVIVQSGNTGTLFFGQTRFLSVLVNTNFGEQNAQVIQIPVGTTIKVKPTAIPDKDADIVLELSPRFSTVDATEIGTGLPTLGIRELQSTLRVRPGDTVMIAGLLSENQTRKRQGIFGIGSRRQDKTSTLLAIFVTAKRVTGEE